MMEPADRNEDDATLICIPHTPHGLHLTRCYLDERAWGYVIRPGFHLHLPYTGGWRSNLHFECRTLSGGTLAAKDRPVVHCVRWFWGFISGPNIQLDTPYSVLRTLIGECALSIETQHEVRAA